MTLPPASCLELASREIHFQIPIYSSCPLKIARFAIPWGSENRGDHPASAVRNGDRSLRHKARGPAPEGIARLGHNGARLRADRRAALVHCVLERYQSGGRDKRPTSRNSENPTSSLRPRAGSRCEARMAVYDALPADLQEAARNEFVAIVATGLIRMRCGF